MGIELLADRPELVAQLAELHYKEWGPMRPGETLPQRIARLRDTCGRSGIPLAVVATDGQQLLGSVLLVASDMETRPELTPWVAGVFVLPEFRHQGIGSALMQYITTKVIEMGLPKFYLYTPSAEAFYSRLGWVSIDRCTEKGVPVVVMSKSLAT